MEDDFAMNIYKQSPITEGNERLYRQAVEEVIKGFEAKVFIDLGCGDGKRSVELGQLMGAEVICGIDHEWGVIQGSKLDDGIAADINRSLPIRSGACDVVMANQVIEHIVRTDLMVKEMFRVLKKGGRAVICTPNLASWHNVAALALGWQPFSMQVSDEYFIGNPKHVLYKTKINERQAHLRVFTHKSLEELLYVNGFDEVKLEGVGYYPFQGNLAKWMGGVDYRHSAYILAIARKRA